MLNSDVKCKLTPHRGIFRSSRLCLEFALLYKILSSRRNGCHCDWSWQRDRGDAEGLCPTWRAGEASVQDAAEPWEPLMLSSPVNNKLKTIDKGMFYFECGDNIEYKSKGITLESHYYKVSVVPLHCKLIFFFERLQKQMRLQLCRTNERWWAISLVHSHRAKVKIFFDVCHLYFHLFCLSFDLFCFHMHFRLVWIGPYTKLVSKPFGTKEH